MAESQAEVESQGVGAEAEEKARVEAEEEAKAETGERIEAEAEEKASAETAEKVSDENKGATKEEQEVAVEQKSDDIDAGVADNVAEEKAVTTDENEEQSISEAEEEAEVEVAEEANAEAEEETKAEAEEKSGAETAEKVSDENEVATREEQEVAVEQKSDDIDAGVADNVAEEKAVTTDESEEPSISETIQRMTRSPAELSGELARASLAICAKDIMQKDVVWGSADDSVKQTLTKMQQQNAGYMMVGQDGILEGIVSKSNITGAISPYLRPVFAKWHRPLDDVTLQIKVKWIMSRPVRTIKSETPLVVIIENMCQFGGRCLPVVNQQGKVQGLVTVFDIFGCLLKSNQDVSAIGQTLQSPPLA